MPQIQPKHFDKTNIAMCNSTRMDKKSSDNLSVLHYEMHNVGYK